MPFPNFAGKHAYDAFFTPHDFLAYLRRTGRLPDVAAPGGVILCYHNALLGHVLATEETEPGPLFGGFHLLRDTGGRVGVCGGFGIGAPAVCAVIEELIALGTTRFVSIGTAGGLQMSSRIGDLIVCDAAVRDEGVSYHYLEAAEYSHPSPTLTDDLKRTLDDLGAAYAVGPSWTIDAPFRETTEEARHYQAAGILTVEMEAAALFAVAQFRRVDLAAAFVISDSLADSSGTRSSTPSAPPPASTPSTRRRGQRSPRPPGETPNLPPPSSASPPRSAPTP